MLTWLKKLVLDILPSVAATIIGAYIVNHYIIPKSEAGTPQPSIASVISSLLRSKPADASTDRASVDKASLDKGSLDKGAVEKASFEKGVAEKTAIEKTVEKAASDKAASDKAASAERTAAIDKSPDAATESAVDTRKHHPAQKSAAKPVAAATPSAVTPAPAAVQEERKASDLARAALERLRGGNAESTKEAAKVDAVKTPDAPRVQPVSSVASVPPMQPLPPAINIARPSPDVFEQGNAAPVVRQPYPQSGSRESIAQNESRRFAPPADIPASRPLDFARRGILSALGPHQRHRRGGVGRKVDVPGGHSEVRARNRPATTSAVIPRRRETARSASTV